MNNTLSLKKAYLFAAGFWGLADSLGLALAFAAGHMKDIADSGFVRIFKFYIYVICYYSSAICMSLPFIVCPVLCGMAWFALLKARMRMRLVALVLSVIIGATHYLAMCLVPQFVIPWLTERASR